MGTYLDFLADAHRRLRPATYVEIGVWEGDSLRLAAATTTVVAIDPDPRIDDPRVLRMTSDDFFAVSDLTEVLGGRPIDLAFVDGMHLFEHALRDVAHLERHCASGSTILVHDVLPPDDAAARRERNTMAWCGDVWKLVPCLRRHRPDLRVDIVDVAPSGMAVLTDLDPTSTVLLDRHDELCAEAAPLPWPGVSELRRAHVA